MLVALPMQVALLSAECCINHEEYSSEACETKQCLAIWSEKPPGLSLDGQRLAALSVCLSLARLDFDHASSRRRQEELK